MIAIAAAVLLAGPAASDVRQIKAVRAQSNAAIAAHDLGGMRRSFADGYTILPGSLGKPLDSEQLAARIGPTFADPTFLTYVHSQHADGKPYLGEYLDEVTGDWINGKSGRSRHYNHSTFADLLITGVVGLRPRADDMVEVFPLLPDATWDWFCLDGVKYHGHLLTVIWDKDGARYHRVPGLMVLADGKQIAQAVKLERITGKLP